MKIAISSDCSKIALTKQFCADNKHILLKHEIYANSTILKMIFQDSEKETNLFALNVSDEKQLISAKVLSSELDFVFLFRDSNKPNPQNLIDLALINSCDEMLVPFATNFNSAKILISSLQWFQ